jgi:glycosyltransferase involved in cell wall biosynthesis
MIAAERDADSWIASHVAEPAPAGSVLVHAPSFAFQAPGGGENQLVQTSRHLHDLGVPVRPFSPWRDRLDDARLIHLYGMSREGLELARVARSRRVPVVLSPICWFEPRALAALAPSHGRGAIDLAKWAARRALPRLPGWRRELLDLSDAILPNSRAEADQLSRLFGTDGRKVHIVPNGVDPRFAGASPDAFRERYGLGEFVLYVGRIELRKNVLGLIQAARLACLPLVAIGAVVPGHEAYGEACGREGGDRVVWIGRVDHADPLLSSAMAAARVFALPSWFETPGLAALEAAVAGCSIVITPYGCTREYFGDRAEYARPGKVTEIAEALARAWDGTGRGRPGAAPSRKGDRHRPGTAGASPLYTAPLTLSESILERFSWSIVAQKTREAYDRVAA